MSLKANTIANYAGKGWSTLMGLVFLPLYIKILGIEAYGLIGAFTVLQAAMLLLDLGLTPTLNREMARLKGGAHTAESIRDLLRSIELICYCVALIMAGIVYLSAAPLSSYWLQPGELSHDHVREAVRLMGIVLASRWLEQVYRAALQGLQDQVWLNIAQSVLETVRWAGAWLFILLVYTDIRGFFWWQFGVSVLTILVFTTRIWRSLPRSSRHARFSFEELSRVRKFAGGMFLTALLVFLLTQIDKILVAKFLPLSAFAIYSLASTAAAGLLQLFTPMNIAVYPKMAGYVAEDDEQALASLFLTASQWLSAILVPPALLMAIFSESVLLLWTGDANISSNAAPTLGVLSAATLLSGLMNLPYMLQLAYGRTALVNCMNGVMILIMVPAIAVFVLQKGMIAAAYALFGLNFVYITVGAGLMFRTILPTYKWRWYMDAVIPPVGGGLSIGIVGKLMWDGPDSRLEAALSLMLAGPTLALVVLLSLPITRTRIAKAITLICQRIRSTV